MDDNHWIDRAARSAADVRAERGPVTSIELLPRHASLRRYARVFFGERSEIVMLMPPADAVPDEVGSTRAASLGQDPFVVVQRWLSHLGLPVPGLFAIDDDAQGLWLEDLGGTDFDAWVSSAPDAVEARYEKVVDLLLEFQTRTAAADPPAIVTARRFDGKMLAWELEHYVEWRLEADLGVRPTAVQRAALDAEFAALVAKLEVVPTTVMHRDFQSHNIMVTDEERLVLLDFQDAMVGPLMYDAVALLRDSYVVLPPDVLDRLVSRWAERRAADSPDLDAATLVRWFHLQTVQRKLKDAGRFVYIDRVKQNPSFLRFIPDSLAYVVQSLRKLPELSALHDVLEDLDEALTRPPE